MMSPLTTAHVSVAGSASPETAWQRYAQPRLWHTWSPQIRSVEYGHPTLRPGTSGVVRTFGGIGIPFTIENVAPAERTWTWRVDVSVLTLRMTHGVRPGDGHGSRTWLEITGPRLVSQAYARFAIIALRRLVRA